MKVKKNIVLLNSVLTEVIHKTYRAADSADGVSGIPTGFTGLDIITSGWQRSDLIILSGYSGMGLIPLMVSATLNLAVDSKIPLAIFSLQYSNEKLVEQMLMNCSEVKLKNIISGRLTEEEWMRLNKVEDLLSNAPIYLYDAPNISIDEISKKAHQLVLEEDIKLLYIDNFELIKATDTISKLFALKVLARELDIPIVALWEFDSNNLNEHSLQYGKIPELDDFPELNKVDNAVDMICVLHRPEYFHITEDAEGNSTLGKAEIIVWKNKYIGQGIAKLNINLQYSKFSDAKYE